MYVNCELFPTSLAQSGFWPLGLHPFQVPWPNRFGPNPYRPGPGHPGPGHPWPGHPGPGPYRPGPGRPGPGPLVSLTRPSAIPTEWSCHELRVSVDVYVLARMCVCVCVRVCSFDYLCMLIIRSLCVCVGVRGCAIVIICLNRYRSFSNFPVPSLEALADHVCVFVCVYVCSRVCLIHWRLPASTLPQRSAVNCIEVARWCAEGLLNSWRRLKHRPNWILIYPRSLGID